MHYIENISQTVVLHYGFMRVNRLINNAFLFILHYTLYFLQYFYNDIHIYFALDSGVALWFIDIVKTYRRRSNDNEAVQKTQFKK